MKSLEVTKFVKETKFKKLEELISGLSHQQNTLLQKLEHTPSEPNTKSDYLAFNQEDLVTKSGQACDGSYSTYKVHKPKRDFSNFDGDDVYKWLYKCNQYFNIKEIVKAKNLKLTFYYLDGMASYQHQNFMKKSKSDQRVTWGEYVEAICCRFGGQNDPLKELKDLRQMRDLESYIMDFDILWNKAEISEKQALIFLLAGLEVKINNLVKMFEPKILNQAYNLTCL